MSLGVYHGRAQQLADAMKFCHRGIDVYTSAIALLAVHSAISFSDAVLVRLTGQRSRGGDHKSAVAAITKACKKAKIQTDGVRHLDKLLSAKTDIAYGDRAVDEQRAEFLYVAADRFQTWAEHVLSTKG